MNLAERFACLDLIGEPFLRACAGSTLVCRDQYHPRRHLATVEPSLLSWPCGVSAGSLPL